VEACNKSGVLGLNDLGGLIARKDGQLTYIHDYGRVRAGHRLWASLQGRIWLRGRMAFPAVSLCWLVRAVVDYCQSHALKKKIRNLP
jgi:hypothetical protein